MRSTENSRALHFPPWIQYGCIFDFAHWLTRVTSRPISSVRRIHLSILVRPFSYVQPAGRSVSYQGRGRDQTSTMLSDVRSVDGPSLAPPWVATRDGEATSASARARVKRNWDRTLPSTAHMLNCCARSLHCATDPAIQASQEQEKQLRTRRHSARRRTQP